MIRDMLLLLIGGGIAVGTYRYALPFLITGTTSGELIFRYIVPIAILLAVFIGIFIVLRNRRRN